MNYTINNLYVNSLEINFLLKSLIICGQLILIDLSSIRNLFCSQNYGFALKCLYAFSRYAWVELMKNKTAINRKNS